MHDGKYFYFTLSTAENFMQHFNQIFCLFFFRNNLPLPKFHYEQKQFNIVKCNTDLTENELQINVVRGIGYVVANPKDVDTYVKVEFPYPQVN